MALQHPLARAEWKSKPGQGEWIRKLDKVEESGESYRLWMEAPPLNSLGAFVTKIHTHTNATGRHEARRTGMSSECPMCGEEDDSSHWLRCKYFAGFVEEAWEKVILAINKTTREAAVWSEKMTGEGKNREGKESRVPQQPNWQWLAEKEPWNQVTREEIPE